jgi:hypothetical protein
MNYSGGAVIHKAAQQSTFGVLRCLIFFGRNAW